MKPDLKNLDLDKLKRGVAERIPHVSVEMNRKRWIVLVCALLAAGGGVWWWLRPRPVPEVLPVVAAEPVEVEDVSVYGEYVGRIRAQQFVEIRARVEGYLERMLFTEGTYIKKGQTLFVIDPKLYRARVNKAKAQLNKAKAQALKAQRDLERIRTLYEQNAASQLDLDNAIASYESAAADVVVCEADLTQAEMTLGYTTVQSPVSGYISERNVDIGTLVGPSGKSLLATVVKSDTVRVDFSMTALDYLRSKARNVNLGQKDTTRKWNPYITVTLADGSQYPYRGSVDSLIRAGRSPDGNLLRAGRDGQSGPHPAAGAVHEGGRLSTSGGRRGRADEGAGDREGRGLYLCRAARQRRGEAVRGDRTGNSRQQDGRRARPFARGADRRRGVS